MEFKQWDGFERGDWCDGIDVRNFIQKNYTPYTGDESFLSVATQRTQKVNSEFKETKSLMNPRRRCLKRSSKTAEFWI